MITREKFKTYGGVFDNFTLNVLRKLSSQRYFDDLAGVISSGKESKVFSAYKDDRFVCVKIYRLENCDFNRMYDYIRYDPRFSGLEKKKRRIIFAWAKREYRNIMLAYDAGARVPKPIVQSGNVLVEEFIGDKKAAPLLKDSWPNDPERFFDLLMKDIKKLYKKGVVHGDLSRFNILNYKEKPYMIDFSQATLKKSPLFNELLKRDMHNIFLDFRKKIPAIKESDMLEKIKDDNT